MKIGVDLHALTGFMQGTHTYTLNIVKQLLEIDRENEYYLYVKKGDDSIQKIFSKPNVFFRHIIPNHRAIRIPVSFPFQLAMDSIDVFHCQYMGPLFGRTPYVVMIHDIIHEYLPEFYPKSLCFLMRLFYPLSARRASRILTVSKHSKRDIVKFYKIREEKIIVTYNAVSKNFYPIEEKDKTTAILKNYGINEGYILFVGRLEPRKNVVRLILAFHKLKSINNINQKLVIVGMKDYKCEEIFKCVNDLNLQKDVIFTGRVENDALPIFYNGASLFVYPSIAEGFGIPPLEAMACGTPVISSDNSAMPEVIGNAGILVDPYNIEDLARTIFKVLSNKYLRKKMKRQGLKRAKSFSWENSARKTLKVCHDVFQETKR